MVVGRAPRNHRASCGGRIQTEAVDSWQPPICPASPATTNGGHIQVAVRVRPLPENELGIIETEGNHSVLIEKLATNGGNGFLTSQQGRIETRSFDRVFGPQATQKEVYENTCAPILTEAVAGARCATIFAYGATGAGKTHTMFGTPEAAEQQGIILRAIPDVFKAVAEYNEKVQGTMESPLHVKASFLEIYNDNVRDLLQDGGGTGICRVLEDERRGIVQVSNLLEPTADCAEDALRYLETGTQSRTVEATAANTQSSRAHAVFTLTIERLVQRTSHSNLRSRLARGNEEQRQLHSKISFIDLAGSERAAFTQNMGQALKDGARINQSLLALANCIDALIAQSRLAGTQTPRKKPPYRDSKLTLMLKGSLMGDGLVAMIANVHPGRLHFEDSNNTLEYAKRASTVKSSNPALTVKSSYRRPSRMSFGTIDEAPDLVFKSPHDEEDDSAPVRRVHSNDLDSASSIPKPRRSRTNTMPGFSLPRSRRTRGVQQLPEFVAASQDLLSRDRCTSSCEITTASSAEECPSEISLSSGQDAGEEVEVTSPLAPVSPLAPSDGALDQDDASFPKECWQEPLAEAGCDAPDLQQCLLPEQLVAAELVAKLQQDYQRMDSRLRSVTHERNMLLEDRHSLEEENERLREQNMEKDRQLLVLLSRCHHAMP